MRSCAPIWTRIAKVESVQANQALERTRRFAASPSEQRSRRAAQLGRWASPLPRGMQRRSLCGMQSPISVSRDVLGGTPVFAGTRVPVQTLLDYLEAGESIDDFLEGFPSVKREQVVSFLELAKDRLIETAL